MGPCDVVANVLNCGSEVSEFELQLRYYANFKTNTLGTIMYPFISSTMNLIVSPVSFYKDGFSIKYPTKVDMPLIKETEESNSLSMVCGTN